MRKNSRIPKKPLVVPKGCVEQGSSTTALHSQQGPSLWELHISQMTHCYKLEITAMWFYQVWFYYAGRQLLRGSIWERIVERYDRNVAQRRGWLRRWEICDESCPAASSGLHFNFRTSEVWNRRMSACSLAYQWLMSYISHHCPISVTTAVYPWILEVGILKSDQNYTALTFIWRQKIWLKNCSEKSFKIDSVKSLNWLN